MELPNYRMPGFVNVVRLLWDKAKDFLTRAFSVILIASVVVWFLQSFDFHFNLTSDSSNSMLAIISGIIAPIMIPLGLGDWRIVTSLITGFMAKESMVSTMEVLFGDGVSGLLGTREAMVLLVFSLIYTPCIATIASVRRELGYKWSLGMIVWQCGIAWVIAALVNLVLGLM